LGFDRGVVTARLAVLEENLRLLEPFADLDLATYLGDPRNYGAAERFLHLAIEAIFDIGTHCISALKLSKPLSYSDIIPALAHAGLISHETQAELEGLAGFRNLLVHEYIRLDRARIHAFLAAHLGGLRRFAADIARSA
jgi:uncharacterized protein YutE (UPF0331/DUF86 family)